MGLDYEIFLESKGIPFLLEANRFVVEGLQKTKIINIPDIAYSKLLVAFDKSGAVVSAPITFSHERVKGGSTIWSAYYAGVKVVSSYKFHQVIQKVGTKVIPSLIGGPVTLGARIGLFIGTTGVTWYGE